jgi:hypothetical protein
MGSPPVAGTALPILPLDARSARDDDDASDALADTIGFGSLRASTRSLLGLGGSGTAFGLSVMRLEIHIQAMTLRQIHERRMTNIRPR